MVLPELSQLEQETGQVVGTGQEPPDLRPGRPQLPSQLQSLLEQRSKRAEELQREIQSLQADVPSGIERMQFAPTRQPFTPGIAEGGGVLGAAVGAVESVSRNLLSGIDILTENRFLRQPGMETLSENIFERLRTEEQRQADEAFRALIGEIETRNEELYRTVWQAGVLNALPTWVQADLVKDFNDVLEHSSFQGQLRPQDQQFLVSALEQVQQAQEEERRRGEEELRRLEQPGGSLQRFLAIDPLQETSDTLVEKILAAGRYQLPEGLTAQQLREMLISMGYSSQEADEQLFDASKEAHRLSAEMLQWTIQMSLIREQGRRLRSGEIQSAIKKAQWLRAASQPAIAILRPMEFWSEQFSQPWTGLVLEAGARLNVASGGALVIEPDRGENEKYLANLARARAEGAGFWEARQIAFEEWDANWFIKFTTEMLLDPTTYIGLGIYARVLKPWPKLSRAVGQFEYGFLKVTDYPFQKLTQGFRTVIPETLASKGRKYGDRTFQLFRHVLETNSNNLGGGVPLRYVTPAQVRQVGEAAINQALQEPQGYDELTRLGQALLGPDHISSQDIASLYDQLGLRAVERPEITNELVESFNRTLELTQGYGTSRLFNLREAVDLINRQLLGLDVTPDLTKATTSWIRSRLRALRRRALRPLQVEDVAEQMRGLTRDLADRFVNNTRSEIALRRYQQGLIGAGLNGVDVLARKLWLNVVDRQINQRFARAYLVFGFYGVMNVAEVATKTLLAGSTPFWRGDLTQKAALWFHAIGGTVPEEILFPTGLNLGIGLPEGELARLATASERRARPVRVTDPRTFANIPSRVLSRYVNAFNETRTLRYLGRVLSQDVKTITGYNLANRVTAAGLQNYYTRQFQKELTQAAPETIRVISEYVQQVSSRLDEVMDSMMAQGYREALFASILSGDRELIRNLPKTFTAGKVNRAQVDKIFDNYTELPSDIQDFLAERAESGELFTRTDELTQMMRERIYYHYFTQPQVFEDTFSDILNTILEEVPANRAALDAKVNLISNTIEVFNDTIHNTLASAVSYARGLRNSRASSEFYDNLWRTQINPQVGRISIGLDQAVQGLKSQLGAANLGRELSQAQRDSYHALLDTLLRKSELYTRARQAQNQARQSYFSPSGINYKPASERDENFWNDFFEDSSEPWNEANRLINQVDVELFSQASSITALQLPPLPSVANRAMTRIDVARLYGLGPQDLEQSLYLTHIQAIQGRDAFVSRTMGRARLAANQQGLDVARLGWTEQEVGRIYDEMAEKILLDPKVVEGTEPLMQQLDSAMSEIRQFAFRRSRGEDVTPVVEQIVEDVLRRQGDAFGASFIHNSQVEALIYVPEVRPGALALPSGQPRIDLQNTRVREFEKATREQIVRRASQVRDTVSSIRSMKTRNSNAASNRLARLRDRFGIDISIPDLNLELYGSLRSQGQSQAIRQEREEAWINFLSSLDRLFIDVDRSITESVRVFQAKNAITGTEGAVRGDIEQLRLLDIPDIEQLQQRLDELERKGRSFGRDALARELGVSRGVVADLERLGFIRRLDGGFEIVGPTPKSFLRQDVLREEQYPGGPTLEFTQQKVREFPTSIMAGLGVGEFNLPRDLLSEQLRLIRSPQWQEVREQALSNVNARRALDFPDYTHQTWFNAIMKSIYPFWNYEAHRWAWWLPREALRHPGVWHGWSTYNDNTDQGYVHVPGTPIEVNPLRGTIFQGGFRRLQQRDYPEFYDRFKGFSELSDYLSRWGFYPGPFLSFLQNVYGAESGRQQWGELLPASARTALVDLPTAILGEKGEALRQIVFPDRFRDFMIATELARLEFDKEQGFSAVDILDKQILGEALTPEEQALWDRAARGVSVWGLLFEQTGLFRFRPEEKIVVQRLSAEILSEETGIPIEHFDTLYRNGIRFEEVFPALSPATKRKLRLLERWQRFTGASVSLLPSAEQASQIKIRRFWDTVETQNKQAMEELLTKERQLRRGEISIDQWSFALKEKLENTGQIIENLKASPEYQDVPVEIQERRLLAEERNIPIFFHPIEELRELYYQKELEEVWNPETSSFELDFDGFYNYRNVLENSLSDNQASELQGLIQDNDTPLENLRYRVSRLYFRPYDNLKDIILQGFAPEEQVVIRQFLVSQNIAGRESQAEELSRVSFQGGDVTVVNEYQNRLRQARRNLREADPELDAWLRFFGKTRASATPQSELRYQEMIRGLQGGAIESLLTSP